MFARHRRTIFIGLFATATFAWAAIEKFDVPAEDLGWLLLYCVIGVAAVAVLAGLCVGLAILTGKLFAAIRGRR